MNNRKSRLVFAGCALILLATEIIIGLYVHDGFVRPYLGDTLVVMLLYCLIRTAFPTKHYWLSGAVFVFAVLVEVSQIFPLCDVLHIQNALLRVLMGTSFAAEDILAYFAGNVLTAGVDLYLWRKAKGKGKKI